MGQRQGKVNARNKEEEALSTPILLSAMDQENEEDKNKQDLHRLAYLGYFEDIKQILANDDFSGESLVRSLDLKNMTPAHNAALGGGRAKTEIVSLLLKHDQDDVRSGSLEPLVNVKDSIGKTILHYAAASKKPDLVNKLLLEFEADPNAMDAEGFTPLHICASQGYSEEAVTCLEVLLKSPKINRYAVCGTSKFLQSAMHLAAAASADKVIKHLLQNGFHHSKKDSRGMTPLMLAATAGDTEEAVSCVKQLLRVSDIKEVNAKCDETGQTALHMAAFQCHFKVLETLLNDGNTDIWVTDKIQRNALHWACEAWFRSNSLACVKLLVECEKVAGWQDKANFLYGDNNETANKAETAMDIVLKHKAVRIAEYLISAHSSPEAWLNDKMMQKIYDTLPEAMIPLLNAKGLSYNPAKFHERNESIDAEFGLLIGFKDPTEKSFDEDELRQESKYLNNILNAPKEIKATLLLHPLIQVFLDRKWKKVRPIVWATIAFQVVWLLLYTVYIVEVFVPECQPVTPVPTSSERSSELEEKTVKTKGLKFWLSLGFYSKEQSNCEYNTQAATGIASILGIMTLLIAVKEIIQMIKKPNYFKSFTNWAQLLMIAIFVVNCFPLFSTDSEIPQWQIFFAAAGIFVAWVLILREIGKFPQCGIYSAILKRITLHCLKMMLFYSPLLLAFGLSIRLLLPGKGQFTYFLFAIFKVVIMMTGELDFEDQFYEDVGPHMAANFILGQVMYFLLVFCTGIVLLNLLVGLAVSDVTTLLQDAEVNRLSNVLEQIYFMESIILSVRKSCSENVAKLLNQFNVTSFRAPGYEYFASKISDLETRSFSPDLKRRIKEVMVPNESDK